MTRETLPAERLLWADGAVFYDGMAFYEGEVWVRDGDIFVKQ